jgi:hypothetical protein
VSIRSFEESEALAMNTVRGFVRSITDRGNGQDRVAVILNKNDRTVYVTVPAGEVTVNQKILLGFDPAQGTYSYPPPA